MGVSDRWHLSRPKGPAPDLCPEHGLPPSPTHGRGDRWQVRWRDEASKQRKRSFTRKAIAERFDTKIRTDLETGSYVDPSDRTTVVDYARRWVAIRPHRPTTARRMSSLVETHIAGTPLGARRLAAVTPSEVQAWVSGRAAVLSPGTVRLLVGLLRSVYTSAVLDRLVGSSPVVRVTLPRHDQARVVPLTVDQVAALAAATPPRNRAMVLAQAGLGLRVGELLALRVDDIDFLGRTMRVETQLTDGSRTRSQPKTPRSRRTVPLPTVVGEALAAHIAAYPPLPDGTLFSTSTGRPYRRDHYGGRIFTAAAAAAGLPPGTTTHDLRHHYASVLLAAGESVVAVAERLGHRNATLVLSTYGHLAPNSEDRTRRAVDSAWSAPNVPQVVEDGR
jgi:integrase